ncbi:hypothetical protein [Chimaeribacter arupi]|uniref:hypothetical protein n=1 Tax=Chimaeribacter arupi TaxID=2060066 RepID=UPI0011AFCE8A|nr:hypothetical protein [Chimaeribacter arupi]
MVINAEINVAASKLVTTNKALLINNPVAIKKGINKEKQDALSVEQKKRARVIPMRELSQGA